MKKRRAYVSIEYKTENISITIEHKKRIFSFDIQSTNELTKHIIGKGYNKLSIAILAKGIDEAIARRDDSVILWV